MHGCEAKMGSGRETTREHPSVAADAQQNDSECVSTVGGGRRKVTDACAPARSQSTVTWGEPCGLWLLPSQVPGVPPASRLLEGRIPEGAWGGRLLQIDSLQMALRSTLALFSTFLAFWVKQMDQRGKGAGEACSCRVREPKPHWPDSLVPGKASPQNAVCAARLGYAGIPEVSKRGQCGRPGTAA